MDSTSQFDKEEMEIIAQAQREQAEADAAMLKAAQEADAAEAGMTPASAAPAAAAPVAAPAPAAAAPAAAPAPADATQAVAPAPAQTQVADKDGGDPRAALRAARRSERTLRAELERTRKELEEAKKTATPTEAATKKPDDDVMRDVEAYAAPAAEYIRELEGKVQELSTKVKQAPAATTAEPEFVPEYIPDAALQEVVDQIDELSDWQNSAKHARLWQAAKTMDTLLADAPAWQGKTDKERLEEVVRRVKQEYGVAAAPAPKATATSEDAARVIAAVQPAAAPVTIGDLRGGSTPNHSTTPDYRQMVRDGMTDEEIMASLGP